MRDFLFRSLSPQQSSGDSWLNRVRENFHQLFLPAGIFPSSANGAPLHLLKFPRSATAGHARATSLLMHAALLAGILLIHVKTQVTSTAGPGPQRPDHGLLTFFRPPDANSFGRPSLGKTSGGGEQDPRPAKHGILAPGSPQPILPPRQVVNSSPELPVPSSVFDPNAPQLTPVINLGLPWLKDDSDSAGPGKHHGFGSGDGGGMGDKQGPGAGQGESYAGPYANMVTEPKCAYCPDPQYTDEAREAKLQGRVTLRVLVGADGRAAQIHLIQGIGLGLDERAVQAIRGWKFVPARDAVHRAVPAWVTIEAVFRLF